MVLPLKKYFRNKTAQCGQFTSICVKCIINQLYINSDHTISVSVVKAHLDKPHKLAIYLNTNRIQHSLSGILQNSMLAGTNMKFKIRQLRLLGVASFFFLVLKLISLPATCYTIPD